MNMTTTFQSQKCRKWLFSDGPISNTFQKCLCNRYSPRSLCFGGYSKSPNSTRMPTEFPQVAYAEIENAGFGETRASDQPNMRWCVSVSKPCTRARKIFHRLRMPESDFSLGYSQSCRPKTDFILRRCQKKWLLVLVITALLNKLVKNLVHLFQPE